MAIVAASVLSQFRQQRQKFLFDGMQAIEL
jgi:hypothetical protein